MEIRWYGTATVNIIHEDGSVLFDPFLSRNPQLDCGTAEELAGLGDIFITHGHFDHALDVKRISSMGNSRIFCAPETAEILKAEGAAAEMINVIKPGDVIINEPFTIRVLAGEHIQPDKILKLKTFASPRMLMYPHNFFELLKGNHKFKMENIMTYQIEAGGKTILHMGSLNLSDDEVYPEMVDVLTVPFQGRSDINVYALQFVKRIKPQTLFFHHFDNTFPPVSNDIDCHKFVKSVHHLSPDLNVIIPEYRKSYSI